MANEDSADPSALVNAGLQSVDDELLGLIDEVDAEGGAVNDAEPAPQPIEPPSDDTDQPYQEPTLIASGKPADIARKLADELALEQLPTHGMLMSFIFWHNPYPLTSTKFCTVPCDSQSRRHFTPLLYTCHALAAASTTSPIS